MRFAILANNYASHVRPMAEGLQRMFTRIGVESKVFYSGLRWLTFDNPFYHASGTVAYRLKTLAQRPLAYPYLARLQPYDAIVLVINMPVAFMRHLEVERIRRMFPNKPVINYDLHYLPTLGNWADTLEHGDPTRGVTEGGHFGLERYDWYLMASVATEYPLIKGMTQPYSLIGLDLNDGTLYPEQSTFQALVDFERPDRRSERAVQIQALEETNTPYVVLQGHYPIAEIRAIYRKSCLYFVAWRESFGLPICELQLCGSYVLTPYARWCPAHWIKEDLTRPGPGRLSPNFIIYDNDKARLKAQIQAIKQTYDPQTVIDTLKHYQPQLYHGNLDQLRQFVAMLEAGQITSRSHLQYSNWPIINQLDAAA